MSDHVSNFRNIKINVNDKYSDNGREVTAV